MARPLNLLPLWLALLFAFEPARAARLDTLEIPGPTLRDNPLGDRALRRVAVFAPEKPAATTDLPLVIYLPGWGGSSEEALATGPSAWFAGVVDRLTAAGAPLRLAVVDCRSRYGGSQYLNSSATGQYEDYVCEEICRALTSKYPIPHGVPISCVIAGHSSGGYGALILAMRHQAQFQGVVALSPDSDFETTHRPLVEDVAVRNVTSEAVHEACGPPGQFKLPTEWLARLIMGLSANYTPSSGSPGAFDWIYDAKAAWQPKVWDRWLALDPLRIAEADPSAFADSQHIYLDGASRDEYRANIGARKIYDVLNRRHKIVQFDEPEGSHSDHLPDRLSRGLAWVFQARLQ